MNGQHASIEIEIMDSQVEALGQPEPASIEKFGYQVVRIF
jgi:hypothetical protein